MHKSNPTRYFPKRRSLSIRSHRPRPVALRLVAVTVFLLGTFHFLRLHDYYRQELRAKFSPTVFTNLSAEDEADQSSSTRWEAEASGDGSAAPQERLGAFEQHRQDWKNLGSGCEGETFTYNETVIKVYHQEKTPFRNCVPESVYNERWPTEIPATLLLGKHLSGNSMTISETSDFVPLVDYFRSPMTSSGNQGSWHLVTPFLPAGSLTKLARKIRASPEDHTPQSLDITYRPSFNRLLSALERLHKTHNLCHDDVKPDNVFVAPNADDTHWLLADLGNVRHPDHPYHASYLWTPLNGQLRDCRANDAFRLLKSYMTFLRMAAADDVVAFDEAFFAGREPWSRLYWRVVDDMVRSPPGGMELSAAALRDVSEEVERPGNYPHYSSRFARLAPGLWNPAVRMWLGREGTAARAVVGQLEMKLSDRVARFWGLTRLRGVPFGGCR